MSQDHTTIIRTDYEPRIIVQEDDGRWFRVLNCIMDDGTAASLPGEAFFVLMAHLRRRDANGLARWTVDQISKYTKRHRVTVFRAHEALTAAKPMLLKRHSDSVWEPLPGKRFAGQRGEQSGQSGMLQSCNLGSAAPQPQCCSTATAPPLRPFLNQPAKTEDREIGQTGNRLIEQHAKAEVLRRGLVGWPELSLFGQRAFAAGDVAGVLRDLGAGEGLYGQLDGMTDMTVAEVMTRAGEVGADKSVINKPYALCYRLAASRGVKLERPEIGRARRMDDEWAELARVRVAKRGKA